MNKFKERPLFSKAEPGKTTITDKIQANMVVLKFREGTQIRLQSGKLPFSAGQPSPSDKELLERLKLDPDTVKTELNNLNSLLQSLDDVQVERMFTRPEEELDKEKLAAELLSDEEVADLNLYYNIGMKVAKPETTVKLIDQLNAMRIVEIGYPPRIPYPAGVDILPTTPVFMGQGYLDAAFNGIDARFAWTLSGGKGRGVRLVDIEGGWTLDHEDLPNRAEYFYDASGINWWSRNHGTAVLGVIGARENAYGITGIAPETELGVGTWISIFGLPAAVDNAAARLRPGDILLIEAHYPGPTSDLIEDVLNNRQRGFVPVEYQQAEYDAIRRATTRGIIVVEAAGNGSMDLDMALFERRFDRSLRDSQAILVGAGIPVQRRPEGFSNFGTRVDVQGWGSSVTTLGYGDLSVPGAESDERQQYTMSFGGTSSASPIVAGAAACLQGIRYANGLPALNSLEMRQLLQETGTPQEPTDPRHIGPLPNLRAAIARMGIVPTPPPVTPWNSLGGVLNSAPAVGRNADGRMEVFVLGTDQQLWHISQTAPSNGWGGWSPVRPSRIATLTGLPVVIHNDDRRLEVFARGSDNAIYHIWQTAPNNGFAAGWDRLGGNCTSDPVVGINSDGRLEAFVRWSDASVHHYWQMWTNGGWYTFGWQSLGGYIQGAPAVGRNQNGRLEVFVRGSDDGYYSKGQITPGGGWADWGRLRMGRLIGDPVVALHSSGRLVVFGQGFDNGLWCIWQTAPNSGWTAFDWQPLGGDLMRGTKVAVTTAASGDLEVFARWNDNSIRRCRQMPGTQNFSAWTSLAGSVSSDPAVGTNAENRLEVFARGSDRSLVHKWQPLF
jgi:serine protease